MQTYLKILVISTVFLRCMGKLAPEIDEELSGGKEGTVFIRSADAFGQPFANLTHEEIRKFQIGNSLNRSNWVAAPSSTTARDGLGPLFNASACASCHARDGRGLPFNSAGQPTQALLFRLSVRNAADEIVPEPTYGGQLQHQAIAGVQPEGRVKIEYEEITGQYPDGTTYRLRKPTYRIEDPRYGPLDPDVMISPRIAPHMAGIGLLDAVEEATLLQNADPDDADGDGISGRPNYVYDVRKGEKRIGKFGWKANEPTAEQQVASAFVNDIGITSSIFPQETLSETQLKRHPNLPNGGHPELEESALEDVVFYVRTLAIPARRDWDTKEVLQGKQLFGQIGC
ncbi:MAG: di-heme oxidoredictase family protein, partial [Spirosomataceae bacterium]